MKLIDLSLSKHDSFDKETYNIKTVIDNHKTVVLLGSPGSGKTSVLKKYAEKNNQNVQYLSVKEFIKTDAKINKNTKFLFLDGLDEYRSVNNLDKAFAITELGIKINELSDINIVISCREMDWYGETDTNNLKDKIKKEVYLYRLNPLDYNQKKQLATLLEITAPDKFIVKYTKYGFLENPHMFTMLANISKNNSNDTINTKESLYRKFIEYAREKNQVYKINDINELEAKDILKYTGYLAFYFIFSGVDEFSDEFIDKIVDNKKGYSRKALKKTVNTPIFLKKSFSHRTIAEFALAHFINEYKLKSKTPLAIERVKSLFIKKDKVPTELRGTYAWLCSLSKKEAFINEDPYYQAVHGDNSLLNNDLKKKVVLAVKAYAKKTPYFFDFLQTMELNNFYDEKLDSFLIKEFKAALKLKNHYIYFIVNILRAPSIISEKMKLFLKKNILDNSITSSFKVGMIRIFQSDIDFLKKILKKIKNNELSDEHDSIKELIIGTLYPKGNIKHISIEDITDCLHLYNGPVIGHCSYLFNTDYEEKFTLVDRIYSSSDSKKINNQLLLPENTKIFIQDYFLETILRFEKGKSAKDIFDTIMHFRKYLKYYDAIKFKSYRIERENEEKNSKISLEKLTNELFSMFLDYKLKQNEDTFNLLSFSSFFNYQYPSNKGTILFEKISSKNKQQFNENLFFQGLYCLSDKNKITPEIKLIAEKHDLMTVLNNFQNPQKPEWQIEHEKNEEERKTKEKKILKDNIEYFSNRTDHEIQSNFNDLYFILGLIGLSSHELTQEYVDEQTYNRLEKLLKNQIFYKLITPHLLTIKSLAKEAPCSLRNIDRVYHMSCMLNERLDLKSLGKDFLKYLYIIGLNLAFLPKISESKFIEIIEIEQTEFIKDTLKEYICLLLDNYLKEYKVIFKKYVTKEDSIEALKTIIILGSSDKHSYKNLILSNCFKAYAFKMKPNKYILFEKDSDISEDNKIIASALYNFSTSKKEAFTMNMALSLYRLLCKEKNRFGSLSSENKIKAIDYLMRQFNVEEGIKFKSGFQSEKENCASFLRSGALNLLNLDELNKLKELRKNDDDDIWTYRILHKISEKGHQDADKEHALLSVERIKDFILSNEVANKEDFFYDIYLKLENLKTEIEKNRNNEKTPFYKEIKTKSQKIEEDCRDHIMNLLKAKYGLDLTLTREKHEANNRVDINIKYKSNYDFEVQIECKKDSNPDINTGISKQLIHKYLSDGICGIYLVFYFGDKKNKHLLLEKINIDIPEEYNYRIKVVCIDLTLP
jgi:hypothetical protein